MTKKHIAKIQRQRLAFEGWFKRYGHQFSITPEPREEVRRAIAEHAFHAGWKARADRAQKKVLRVTQERGRV